MVLEPAESSGSSAFFDDSFSESRDSLLSALALAPLLALLRSSMSASDMFDGCEWPSNRALPSILTYGERISNVRQTVIVYKSFDL